MKRRSRSQAFCRLSYILLCVMFISACASVSSVQDDADEGGYFKAKAAYERGDYATALKRFRPLAEMGDTRAQGYLGLMYLEGQGVPRNDKIAFKWFKAAAERENAQAQHNLGWMYEEGRGVTRDDQSAVKWYMRAAALDLVKSQHNLAVMYENGRGVTKDNETAVKWFKV